MLVIIFISYLILSFSSKFYVTLALTTRTSSHQDLSVNDLARQPSSNNNSEDEPADMDARGKELASRCWNEDEDFLAKEKIAEWLGGQ